MSVEHGQNHIFTLDTTYRGMYDACMTISLPTAVPIETPDFAKTDSKTPAQILRNARRILEERGWYQGDLYNEDTGAVCAIGALWLANGYHLEEDAPNEPNDPAVLMGVAEMERFLGLGPKQVPDWNDAAGRTRAEVTAAFSSAAAAWEAEHAQ